MTKSDYRNAAKKALTIRKKASISLDNSFCVFDLADRLGAEVKFVDIKSFDGAYFKKSKTILISTYRPEGRLRFTCAHELGHFVFGHGDHFDELVEKADSTEARFEERLCDAFASFLLMPKTTLISGFKKRDVEINEAQPIDFFVVASWIGVGYSTILKHFRFGLNLLSFGRYKNLVKIKPKTVKSELCGLEITSNLIVVDKFWNGRPIDLQVGDYLMLIEENSRIEGGFTKIELSEKNVWVAKKPGIYRALIGGPDTYNMVRIRKKDYVGRAIFRNLEEE